MENVPAVRTKPALVIKNLCPGLSEIGKIKIGQKGATKGTAGGVSFQPPQKLDHFLITTLTRGADGNFIKDVELHELYGEKPTEIRVRLIYDDIALNFATRYICYYGKKVFCSGDGEVAMRLNRSGVYEQHTCPCGRQDPKYTGDDGPNGPEGIGGKNGKGKCKINGILSSIIDGANVVGGVWKFRTTSYNTVVGILSSLALIQRITGGRLAGIPLKMVVSPKTVQDPINQGQQTIYVVSLQYVGDIDTLRSTGYQIAMDEAKHGIQMSQIEETARLMLTHTPQSGLGDDPADDVVAEYYPEELQPAASIDAVVIDDALPPPATVTGDVVDTVTGEVMDPAPAKQEKPKGTRKKSEAPPVDASLAGEPAPAPPLAAVEEFPEPPASTVIDNEPEMPPAEVATEEQATAPEGGTFSLF